MNIVRADPEPAAAAATEPAAAGFSRCPQEPQKVYAAETVLPHLEHTTVSAAGSGGGTRAGLGAGSTDAAPDVLTKGTDEAAMGPTRPAKDDSAVRAGADLLTKVDLGTPGAIAVAAVGKPMGNEVLAEPKALPEALAGATGSGFAAGVTLTGAAAGLSSSLAPQPKQNL